MSERPVGVALVGCGAISDQYLTNLGGFPDVQVVFCADLDTAVARRQAEKYDIPAAGDLETALARSDVDLVVNLTVPSAHGTVAAAALDAGKHVWNEKPLAPDLVTARMLLDKARGNGLRIGCAPDTVLGAGVQSARRLIDAGGIGRPLSVIAMMQGPGPEAWHPNPGFLFQPGGGPLLDMGPYYLSMLVTLLGPIVRVGALGGRGQEVRTVGSGPLAGTTVPVEVATHVSALAEFASGALGTLVFSFDSALHRHGFIEVSGTEATLALPDPNHFTGDSRLLRMGSADWTPVPATGTDAGRGIGVVDLVRELHADRPHRASGELALHVLDVMLAIERSAAAHGFEAVPSTADRPAPVDPGWDPRTIGAAS